ncbi:MAG TPA: FlgD immunoglobulin-like domain containing protein, partial [Candidatus Latescibacteria bacterium]|nr:FlgD immunoglobulin-like domain containing protein [Candidatus Latescibacterota bacterium]
ALLRTLTGHTDGVTSVAISPDGQTIVSSSLDGTIKVWRLLDGAILRTLAGHTGYVMSAAITPDGNTIISGGADKTVKRWRLSDGQLLGTFTGHTNWVTSVAVAPDGETVVSGSWDYTVKVWRTHPVSVLVSTPPTALSLSQNAPNPFNPSTTLRFTLPEAGHVTLAVYDVNGRLVRTLVGRTFLSGHHEVVWDGCDDTGRAVASGVYVCRLTAAQGVLTKRMVLVR